MRVSGLVSTVPKAAKSTTGTLGSPRPPCTPGAGARPPPLRAFLTKPLTSSSVMRDLKPVPVTRDRSTPSSRAKRRTEGLACAAENPLSLTAANVAPLGAATAGVGAAAGAGAAAGVGAGAGGAALAGAASGAGAGDTAAGAASAAPSSTFTVATTSPGDTVPPFVATILSMTPATVDGTSMVAFSVSSVTSGPSTSMASPGLTSTAMTATSLKLPMSGTRTSMTRVTLYLDIS